MGSRTISRILPQNLSPASVRNVMMDLEDAGLIFSPHTSAGRVPTEQGLRFFVDAVMEVGAMSTDERARIDAQIAASNRQRRIEDVLGEATTLLSGLSHCAGVIVTPKINARLKHIEFVNLGPGRALVILVGEDGSVENRVIEVPRGPAALHLHRRPRTISPPGSRARPSTRCSASCATRCRACGASSTRFRPASSRPASASGRARPRPTTRR